MTKAGRDPARCRGRFTDVAWGQARLWLEQGKSQGVIAKKLGVARSTLQRWLKSDVPPSQKPKAVRPLSKERRARAKKCVALIQETEVKVRKKVSPVRRLVTLRPVTVRKYPSAAAVARKLGNVSAKTVVRDLKKAGLRLWSEPHGPVLTADLKKKRVVFCKDMLKTIRDPKCKPVMFSDEKQWDTQTKRKQKQWAPDPQRLQGTNIDQGAARLQVLGFISRTHRRLVYLDPEPVTAAVYQRHLTAYRPALRRHLFQQDNALPHTAVVRSGWFARQGISLLAWPPYSPDLNVIETLWARLSDKVRREAPYGAQELRAYVQAAWRSITQSEIAALVDEFEERVRLCVKLEGGRVTRTLLRRERAAKARKSPGGRGGKTTRAAKH